jgi:hypothetical protein
MGVCFGYQLILRLLFRSIVANSGQVHRDS